MTPALKQQYHAELIVNGSRITIDSGTPENAKHFIQSMLGQANFTADRDSGTILVTQPNLGGNQPIGWLTLMNVPETLSVQVLTANRDKVAA